MDAFVPGIVDGGGHGIVHGVQNAGKNCAFLDEDGSHNCGDGGVHDAMYIQKKAMSLQEKTIGKTPAGPPGSNQLLAVVARQTEAASFDATLLSSGAIREESPVVSPSWTEISSKYCSDDWANRHSKRMNGVTPDYCKSACDIDPSCFAVSFSYSEGYDCVLCPTIELTSHGAWATYISNTKNTQGYSVPQERKYCSSNWGAAHAARKELRTLSQCMLLCDDDPNCHAISFSASEGNDCVFCSSTTMSSHDAWVTLIKQTQFSRYCSHNWARRHADRYEGKTIAECKAYCDQQNACTAFSYSASEGNDCVLCDALTLSTHGSWVTFLKSGGSKAITGAATGWIKQSCSYETQKVSFGTNFASTQTNSEDYTNAVSASTSASYTGDFVIGSSFTVAAEVGYSHTWSHTHTQELQRTKSSETEVLRTPPDAIHTCLWVYGMGSLFQAKSMASLASTEILWMRSNVSPKCVPRIYGGNNDGQSGCADSTVGCTVCQEDGCLNGGQAPHC